MVLSNLFAAANTHTHTRFFLLRFPHFTGASPLLPLHRNQPFREMVMVKKERLQRPIINTVCNVDMEVFNLSLSLCLYLSSSVSLCLRIPAFAFVSTIINHPKPPPQMLWDAFACVTPLTLHPTSARRRTYMCTHVTARHARCHL